MSPGLYWLCTKAAYLDRIPRYGRRYRLRSRVVTESEFVQRRAEPGFLTDRPTWSWHKRGNWGFTVLKVLGVKDRYWDEYDRRHPWRD
jgi:hypothetical protein